MDPVLLAALPLELNGRASSSLLLLLASASSLDPRLGLSQRENPA